VAEVALIPHAPKPAGEPAVVSSIVTELPAAEVNKLRDMMRPVTAKYGVNVGQDTLKELQNELAKVRK